MYLFICKGNPPHFSHSASETQHDPSCPVCHSETRLVLESKDEKGRLAKEHQLNWLQLFELAEDLKQRGYSEANIAHILRLTTPELRWLRAETHADIWQAAQLKAVELKADGKSISEIALELGVTEVTVRSFLEEKS